MIDWTPELEDAICNDIESGLTLRDVASKNGVSKALILKNVRASTTFCDQYTRAIETRTDIDFEGLADQISEAPVVVEGRVDSGWVNWKRLQIDTLKWALSKRVPKKYGERSQVALTDPEGGPLQIISSVPRPPKE